MIGTTIAHYDIIEKLGEGGMGVVYKAQDTKLNRVVALKFLTHASIANETVKMRFLQEARAAATLNHPNICVIHDIREEAGQQFIVMEYVDGTTLRRKFEDASLKLNDTLTYAIQIGDALQDAHSKGIVHRDIKADNVMVNAKNQIKVMDFGLAKLKGTAKLTRTSSTIGTLAYMAPEQIQGGEVDERSDIFSFGVLLYEMLTGRMPFRGEHEAAMVYSIVNEEPLPIENKDLPPILVNLFQRCLEKDPEDRYQTIHEAVIELRRSQKQSSKVHRTSAPKHSSEPAAPLEAATTSGPARSALVRKISLLAGVFLIAVTAVVYLVMRLGGKERITYSLTDMEIVPITTDGNAYSVGLSPDGQYAVYAIREKGLRSIWVNHVSSGSIVQVLPPTGDLVFDIEFSGSSSYFFYLVRDKHNPARRTLMKMPVLGGSVQSLGSFEYLGSHSISNDGTRIAYTRAFPETGEFAVMIANLDGSHERKLASDKAERWYHGKPRWSPDDRLIASPWSTTAGRYRSTIKILDVADESSEDLLRHHFESVGTVQWTPDGKSLVFEAGERLTEHQIWIVNYPEGDAARFTNDLIQYYDVEISDDGSMLLSLATETSSTLSFLEGGNQARSMPLATSKGGFGGIDQGLDGLIVYSAVSGKHPMIFTIRQDGTGKRQLTFGEYNNFWPGFSADGKWIVFTSTRIEGLPRVWLMLADGSGQRMLSNAQEGYSGDFTPDGKYVIYHAYDAGPPHVMMVPVEGGEAVRLSEVPGGFPRFSPDGSLIMYQGMQTDSIYIMSASGGQPVYRIARLGKRSGYRWRKDGRAITFLQRDDEVSNIWEESLDGKHLKKLTSYTERGLSHYHWSSATNDLVIVWDDVKSNVVLFKKRKQTE